MERKILPGQALHNTTHQRHGVRTLLLCILTFVIQSCSQEQNQSDIRTVSLPMTGVRDQGRFGICWSYGTLALVESLYKQRTGQDIDLSEEAVAFYHMAEGIKVMIDTLSVPDLIHILSRRSLPEGWNTLMDAESTAQASSAQTRQHDGLGLIDQYGLVPESVWSFKVRTATDKDRLFQGIANNLGQLMTKGVSLKSLSFDQVIDSVLVGGNAFPSRPPQTFLFGNQTYRATDFVTSFLQFSTADYRLITANGPGDYDRIVQSIKRSLDLRIPVPLGFPINIDRLEGENFAGGPEPENRGWYAFGRDGGHLVLVTDYVNKGSIRGELPGEEQQRQLQRPSADLDYLIVKNSWGIGAKTNEQGQSIGYSDDGYYSLDQAYLRGSLTVSALTFNPYFTLAAVVPVQALIGNSSLKD